MYLPSIVNAKLDFEINSNLDHSTQHTIAGKWKQHSGLTSYLTPVNNNHNNESCEHYPPYFHFINKPICMILCGINVTAPLYLKNLLFFSFAFFIQLIWSLMTCEFFSIAILTFLTRHFHSSTLVNQSIHPPMLYYWLTYCWNQPLLSYS